MLSSQSSIGQQLHRYHSFAGEDEDDQGSTAASTTRTTIDERFVKYRAD